MADYITTISIPPNLLAMIRQESKDTGNSMVAVMRKRIWDSYQREASEFNISLPSYQEEAELEAI